MLNLPFEEGMQLYIKANEKYVDERLWEMWLSQYPNMTQENFISFEQFKLNARSRRQMKRSEKEILMDADNILKSMKKRSA